jgi:hypothetical protein
MTYDYEVAAKAVEGDLWDGACVLAKVAQRAGSSATPGDVLKAAGEDATLRYDLHWVVSMVQEERRRLTGLA